MNKSNSIFIFGTLVFGIILVSGCIQPPAQQETQKTATPVPTIEQPMVKLSAGNYLVDSKGMTLYLFANDIEGDSKCSGGCLNLWPVFYQEKISVASGLSSSDFGTITRDGGTKQTTYKGWPLYYFSSDVNPGDIKGEGYNKIWFIARPDYTIFIANKNNTKFIVDSMGKTLYNFTKDTPGVSNCMGNCLKNWPVFYSEKIVVPSTMNTSDFGIITDSNGSKQITYKQMPLYYYINDSKRGDMNGQGVNNAWYLVPPDAPILRAAITPSPTATVKVSTPTATVGGGGGY